MSIAASVSLTGLTFAEAKAIIQEAQKKSSSISFTGFETFKSADRKALIATLL